MKPNHKNTHQEPRFWRAREREKKKEYRQKRKRRQKTEKKESQSIDKYQIKGKVVNPDP